MRILWFTWKDMKHPEKGGAELVTAEITKRLVRDGHQVKIITAGYPLRKGGQSLKDENFGGFSKKDTQNGAEVIRVGNKFTVYWQAYRYYKKNLQDWPDIVIEEVNTIPFFTQFYTQVKNQKFTPSDDLGFTPSDDLGSKVESTIALSNKKDFRHSTLRHSTNYLFFHQLAREIWFYQMPWFIGWIGYLGEMVYLRLLSHPLRKGGHPTFRERGDGGFLSKSDSPKVITVSNSTKQDLMKYGFKKDNINIISEGVHIEPVEDLAKIKKYEKPTMLSLGAVRKMKRTIHQLKAFEIAKKEIPDLQLKISGLVNDNYGKKFVKLVEKSPYKKDIEFMGRVSDEKKEELMQRSHLITVTSLKEGWGLIVTEANSQGTPAVVYDVDGLRDAVKHDETGLVCQPVHPLRKGGQSLKDENFGGFLRLSKFLTFDFSDFKDFRLTPNTPANLAKSIVQLLQDKEKYDKLRTNAWKWSKEITFEKCYEDFRKSIM